MKKILSIAFAGAALMSLVACSDASYDEKYADPSKTTTVGVPQVFTAVQYKGNTWMNPMYMRCFTQTSTSGTFSGIIGNSNGKGRFQGAGESYFNNRWKNFYDMLTQYRLLEKTYDDLADGQKSANEVFVVLGRVMVEAQLHEMLSLFGDVPFTGAGTLWNTSDYDLSKSTDVYDDDVTLYKQILADLKTAGDYLAGTVDATGLSALKRQDITFAAGDQQMWRKYVNSLRLRIALHLATNGDCTTEARAAIAEILNSPSTYPVIESNDDNMGVETCTNDDTFNFGKSFSQGLHTWGTYATVGQALLDVMGVNADGSVGPDTDPRISTMLDPNPDGNYISYDVNMSSTDISKVESDAQEVYKKAGITSCNYWAQVDSAAFHGKSEYNGNMKLNGIWISAAEVALSKAECYLMGYGVSANTAKAKECFVNGVLFSTEYYRNLKVTSSLYTEGFDDCAAKNRKYTAPTDSEATIYAEKLWAAAPTQATIVAQNWLNHFVFNELEAWNLVRRTGYPVVKFAKDGIMATYPTPPLRLPYPSDEINSNTANYNDAKAKNYQEDTGFYTNLFWAKSDYYTIIATN